MNVRTLICGIAFTLGAASPFVLQATAGDLQVAQSTDQGTAAAASQMTQTEKDTLMRLESAGYTQVRNVKAGAEVISAKGVKDGKEMNIIIDSFGKIIATPAEP